MVQDLVIYCFNSYAKHSMHNRAAYRMPRSLRTIRLNIDGSWMLLTYCDICMLRQRIEYVAKSSYAATLELLWSWWWHQTVTIRGIAQLQVIAMCCESAHVRGVGCNVSGIWNIVVT